MQLRRLISLGATLFAASCSVYDVSLGSGLAGDSGPAQGSTGGGAGGDDVGAGGGGAGGSELGSGGMAGVGGSTEMGAGGTAATTTSGPGGSGGTGDSTDGTGGAAGSTGGGGNAGAEPSDAGPDTPSCVSETDAAFCARLAKNCGTLTAADNCAATRTVQSCGTCTAPQTCGARALNVCGAIAVTTVDDSAIGTGANQFNYVGGGWRHCTACGDGPQIGMYNNSNSWNSTTNEYITVVFSGVQIKLYAVKDAGSGIGAVSIDAGAEANVDFYGALRVGNQLMWSSPILPAGTHTFKLRLTGTKNASSSNYFVIPDRVDISS